MDSINSRVDNRINYCISTSTISKFNGSSSSSRIHINIIMIASMNTNMIKCSCNKFEFSLIRKIILILDWYEC